MEVFVLHILKLNIIAAIVILLVKTLAVSFKSRFSARWKYVIWLLVAISLLVPVRLTTSFSVVDLKVQGYSAENAESALERMKKGMPAAGNEKDQRMTAGENAGQNNGQQVRSPQAMQDESTNAQNAFAVRGAGRWMQIAAVIFLAVWLIVAVLKLAGEILAYYLSMRNLERMSLPVSDPVSIQIYRNVCRDRQVRKLPELRQNAGLTTPLLAGIFHTKLYLPATGYSAEERKLVFYHELTHYCHRDLWYKMVLRICASVYWFNPFLLVMLREADKDIENLCDAAVVHSVNQAEHRLYRQLLLRTVAMNNQIPYVTASLNDSEMVFKDRILYMLNIRKLRRGILPGILVAMILAGGNLAFTVSAGAEATNTEWQNEQAAEDPNANAATDTAPFSEMVDMQEITQDEQDGAEATATENALQDEENSTENTATETASVSDEEDGAQTTETSASEGDYDADGDGYDYEQLPDGVPYTSGFSGSSGVASIVAPGEGDTESRVLYDNGDGTYSDDNGFRYSYQGNGTWADANGNSYNTWNDEDYNSGTQLGQHELQGSNGTVDVKETTNGDYYYRDSNGVGYTDNGDGTWTDENGNTYTE